MKSNDLFNKIICKLDLTRGAPMGRNDVDLREHIEKEKYFDRKIKIDSQGYDKGGAYWGIGRVLRVTYNTDLTYIRFYRPII